MNNHTERDSLLGKRSKRNVFTPARILLVVLTEFSSLLYSGSVFGWAPMLLVLKTEGRFADLCIDGEYWCTAQQERLALCFTCASMLYSLSGVAIGSFMDKFGPAWGVLLAGTFSIIGFFLFGMYDSPYMPDWVGPEWTIVGYCFIALGGMSFFQVCFCAQFVFGRECDDGEIIYEKQTLIIAGITTLGDASACIWLVFEVLTRNGIALWVLFLIYSVVTLMLMAVLFVLWRTVGQPLDPDDGDEDGDEEREEIDVTLSLNAVAARLSRDTGEKVFVPLKCKPFAEQIRSLEFFFVVMVAMIHITRGNLFLGLLAQYYSSTQFGEPSEEVVQEYVDITSLLIPLGCLFAPVIDHAINKLGFPAASHVVSACGLVYSLLMLINVLPVQIATTCVFVFYRAFVFVFPSAFIGAVFGQKTVGRVSGLQWTLLAPFQLLISPALSMSLETFHNDFRPLTIIAAICLVLPVGATVYLQRYSKERAVNSFRQRKTSLAERKASFGFTPKGTRKGSMRK